MDRNKLDEIIKIFNEIEKTDAPYLLNQICEIVGIEPMVTADNIKQLEENDDMAIRIT